MHWSSVAVVTKPAGLPISVGEIRAHLNLEGIPVDDGLLARYIAGAVARIDGPNGIGWAMLAQTWRYTLDAFPYSVIELPGAPVKGVASISFENALGVTETVAPADYRVDLGRDPARISPAPGTSWPSARDVIGAVAVEYTLGESDPADVPADLIDALALLVGHRYENREASVIGVSVSELPLGVPSILNDYRRNAVAA